MASRQTYDLIIIGAGAGGLSLASGAAQLGLRTALLERNLMGGDCLNYGCVPSKTLLAAAKNFWSLRKYQGQKTNITSDFPKIMDRVKNVITHIAIHDSVERFQSLGVTVIQQDAYFIDDKTIQAGAERFEGKYIVIATGSIPLIPPIPGLQNCSYLTNETIFDLPELPKHLLVIGGGPIGCELAQAFAMLGSKVSLIEAGEILRNDDREAVAIVRRNLEQTNISLYEHSEVVQVNKGDDGILVQTKHKNAPVEIKVTHILVATGRKAAIDSLQCARAGINTNEKGIILDERLRTSNKRVFVIGDAAGKLQFTHVANYHAGIVLRNIAFKIPANIHKQVIPWVTFTAPELAHVGIKENSPEFDSKKMKVLRCSYEDNDRAQTEGETIGLLKVVVNSKGLVLGATITGSQAGELLVPWTIAVRERKSLRMFTDLTIAYPTLSEISKRLASQFYAPKLFSSKVRRLVRFLIWF